jgi:hypothetical protein
MYSKQVIAKNYANFEHFSLLVTHLVHSFLFITFLWALFKACINKFEISMLFDIRIVFNQNILWVHISIFSNFACKCEKTVHFQTFSNGNMERDSCSGEKGDGEGDGAKRRRQKCLPIFIILFDSY